MRFSMPCMLIAEARTGPSGFSREIENRLGRVRRCFYRQPADALRNLHCRLTSLAL